MMTSLAWFSLDRYPASRKAVTALPGARRAGSPRRLDWARGDRVCSVSVQLCAWRTIGLAALLRREEEEGQGEDEVGLEQAPTHGGAARARGQPVDAGRRVR